MRRHSLKLQFKDRRPAFRAQAAKLEEGAAGGFAGRPAGWLLAAAAKRPRCPCAYLPDLGRFGQTQSTQKGPMVAIKDA